MRTTITRRFQFEGRTRSYLVHKPPSATAPLQAVMVLHGARGSGQKLWDSHWRGRWANREFMLVFPNAEVQTLGGEFATAWVHDGTPFGDDPKEDERFLLAVMDDIQRFAQVQNWFLCGFSSGGGMTWHMLTRWPWPFDGFGVTGAALKLEMSVLEAPAHRPSIFVCGTKDVDQWAPDPPTHIGALGTIEWLRARCACSTESVLEVRNGSWASSSIRSYKNCGFQFRSIIVERGGHDWFTLSNHGIYTDSEFVAFFRTAGLR